MADTANDPCPALSVVLPASNEEALIGPCLEAVLASDWTAEGAPEVIVVANGCHDQTAARARAKQADFAARGWSLTVLELDQGGKLGALNAGDKAARAGARLYLDADVRVTPPLLGQIAGVLQTDAPCYASGAVRITAQGFVSRAYARIWRRVPFMAHGVPGCGVFAVNAAGRARWEAFPDIISDDTFVRLSFAPEERKGVPASYDWPIAEGFARLVRVRRRQDAGVAEIAERFPHLLTNDDKLPFSTLAKLRMALSDPIGFAIYTGVALTVKLTKTRHSGWSRSR